MGKTILDLREGGTQNKKRGWLALLLAVVMALTACGAQGAAVPEVDYARAENWAWYGIGEEQPVDVFLVCPTVDTRDEFNMSMTDEKNRSKFLGALNMERGIYEDSARLFAPYYRQAAMKVFGLPREEWEPYLELAYRDVSADYPAYVPGLPGGRTTSMTTSSSSATYRRTWRCGWRPACKRRCRTRRDPDGAVLRITAKNTAGGALRQCFFVRRRSAPGSRRFVSQRRCWPASPEASGRSACSGPSPAWPRPAR